MAAGLQRHGVTVEWGQGDCDLAIVWSHNEHAAIERQRAKGRDYLVVECGYLGNRLKECSLGFNGLNGDAEAPPAGDINRSNRWGHLLQFPRRGDYLLIIGQVPGDAAIRDINFSKWVSDAEQAARHIGLPIYYRPHPQGHTNTHLPELKGSLAGALQNAHQVITYSSNTGVDAVLAGCSVVAYSKRSMVWQLASHDGRYKQLPDRTEWLNALAWRQWQLSELQNGSAWAHLKQRYQ